MAARVQRRRVHAVQKFSKGLQQAADPLCAEPYAKRGGCRSFAHAGQLAEKEQRKQAGDQNQRKAEPYFHRS